MSESPHLDDAMSMTASGWFVNTSSGRYANPSPKWSAIVTLFFQPTSGSSDGNSSAS